MFPWYHYKIFIYLLFLIRLLSRGHHQRFSQVSGFCFYFHTKALFRFCILSRVVNHGICSSNEVWKLSCSVKVTFSFCGNSLVVHFRYVKWIIFWLELLTTHNLNQLVKPFWEASHHCPEVYHCQGAFVQLTIKFILEAVISLHYHFLEKVCSFVALFHYQHLHTNYTKIFQEIGSAHDSLGGQKPGNKWQQLKRQASQIL